MKIKTKEYYLGRVSFLKWLRKILWYVKITLIGFCEGFLNLLPEGSYGDLARGLLLRIQVGSCGKKLRVSRNVKVINPRGLIIGDNVYIGYGTWMNAQFGIVIGSGTMFGPNVIIASGNHTFTKESMSFYGESKGSQVTIGSGCWLGGGVAVTSSGKIEDYCLIGANAVITKRIPKNSKVIGINKVVSAVIEEGTK